MKYLCILVLFSCLGLSVQVSSLLLFEVRLTKSTRPAKLVDAFFTNLRGNVEQAVKFHIPNEIRRGIFNQTGVVSEKCLGVFLICSKFAENRDCVMQNCFSFLIIVDTRDLLILFCNRVNDVRYKGKRFFVFEYLFVNKDGSPLHTLTGTKHDPIIYWQRKDEFITLFIKTTKKIPNHCEIIHTYMHKLTPFSHGVSRNYRTPINMKS